MGVCLFFGTPYQKVVVSLTQELRPLPSWAYLQHYLYCSSISSLCSLYILNWLLYSCYAQGPNSSKTTFIVFCIHMPQV